jgi:hypothetical protein
MSKLFVIVSVIETNVSYTLFKKHTTLEQCKSIPDILSLIGEKDFCVHQVNADVGLMEGYATNPTEVYFNRILDANPANRATGHPSPVPC